MSLTSQPSVMGMIRTLVPSIGVFFKGATLGLHDTESVSTGGLHDPPPWQLLHFSCTQTLQAPHLGLNIVGLDVDMYPARMGNLLKQSSDFYLR